MLDKLDLRGLLVQPAVLDRLAPRDRPGRKASLVILDLQDRPGPPDHRAIPDRKGLQDRPAR